MEGGYKSNSETGPSVPTDAKPEADHGGAKLAKMAQSHPNYTHGVYMGDEDYNVDRKNVDQPTPKTPADSDGKGGIFYKGSKK